MASQRHTPQPEVPDMVCRQCLQPLRRFYRSDTPTQVTWQHSQPGDHDHEPDPTPRADAPGARVVCDFCSQPDPAWIYHTHEELTLTVATPTYTGKEERRRFSKHWETISPEQGHPDAKLDNIHSKGWAACADCAVFIELRDMQRLITRVRRVGPEAMRTAPRNAYKTVWRDFFRSISHREAADP